MLFWEAELPVILLGGASLITFYGRAWERGSARKTFSQTCYLHNGQFVKCVSPKILSCHIAVIPLPILKVDLSSLIYTKLDELTLHQ